MNVLIAGQGLAGSVLALELMNEGAGVTVADLPVAQNSTRVAAGVVRPITGRHQVKSHKADQVIPFAFDFYKRFEKTCSSIFFHHLDVLQLFSSPSVLNSWYGRAADSEYSNYIGAFLDQAAIPVSLQAPHGGVILKQCGYLDTAGFIEAVRNHLTSKNAMINDHVMPGGLEFKNGAVKWRDAVYDCIVFCEGAAAAADSLFSFLPFRPVKGEILDFSAEGLQRDYIVNNGNYIIPLDSGSFRVGATNSWDETGDDPTIPARQVLETWLTATVRVPFTITRHVAGMRPAVIDRKPLLGFHPHLKQVAIFNGLGSKGVMLAPYYAHQLMNVIGGTAEPDPEVDIRRFSGKTQ
jgi:glycine oxidase